MAIIPSVLRILLSLLERNGHSTVNMGCSIKSMVSPDLSQKKILEDHLKSLREALASNKDIQIVHKYFVSLPTEETHHKCHPTKGVMGLSQRVHPEIIAKIHD